MARKRTTKISGAGITITIEVGPNDHRMDGEQRRVLDHLADSAAKSIESAPYVDIALTRIKRSS